ncbi:MAG: hypothetical protein IKO65_02145 [Victivallales bacterium]|nr:hypothetical protein [Victivallales bacterium]
MKKTLEGFYAFFLILAVGFWCQAADTVVAEWDFSVNTTGTTDGRIADGFTRGATVIEDGWLTMPAGTGVTEPQGFQVSKAVHPELAPQSGFRVEAVAKLADDEPDKNLLTILDTKYLLDVGPKSREQAFHGFLFGLVKASNGKSARLRISLGFQADSVQVDSDFFNVVPGKEQSFAVSYDGRSQVSFWVDGKSLGVFAVAPGGAIEPSIQRAVVGDRVGANHFPWRGAIRKVTLTAFPPAPEPEPLPEGESVLAEWDFGVRTDGTVDGKIADGFMRGKTVVEDGWLVMPNGTGNMEPQGFQVSKAVHPELAPQSGFRMEVLAKLRGGEFDTVQQTFFDAKYYLDLGPKSREPAFHGFLFALVRGTSGNARLRLFLGFKNDSVQAESKFFEPKPGQEQRFSVSYDGARTVTFWVDGVPLSTHEVKPGGPIEPAVFQAVIGDRYGSNHNPFRGSIRKVRLVAFPAPLAFLSSPGRHAFVRGEENARLQLKIHAVKEIQPGAKVRLSFVDNPNGVFEATLKDGLVPNTDFETEIPFRPDYAVGSYPVKLELEGEDADGKAVAAVADDLIDIGPQLSQDGFPIILWSSGLPYDTLLEHGMTHELYFFMHFLIKYGMESLKTQMKIHLDSAVAAGARISNQFGITAYFQDDYPRVRADGTKVPNGLEAANPEFQAKVVEYASQFAELTSEHPGCDSVLLNSEVRDHSVPSFGSSDPKAFEAFAGFPVPAEAVAKDGISWRSRQDFPLDRVIPYDDPLLVFYRWFWTVGDGWNVVQSKLTEAIHEHHKLPIWTWFDPAVRVPPLWGSGGAVDVISQWTYAYPDPMRTGGATDELFAMAEGRPGQKVMSMTQFICYRNQTAPVNEKVANPPAWLQGNETAGFISIPPDSLTEATWAIIARPVQGIMYHGSNSVWGESEAFYLANMRKAENSHAPYCTTNPDTKVALSKVLNNVVKPLGPTLKRIPARAPEVVLLHSFASSIYAKRGTWGWGQDWLSHVHLMFSWANLAPSIYYEEKVLRDGLDGVKVLGLFHCDVLTREVVDKILEWQAKGGIVVADEYLAPAILADIVIREVPYAQDNDQNKADLQKLAHELREQLDPHFQAFTDASNYDIVTRPRTYKNADYIFAINDKREYGDYIGQWKRTMEKGVPNSGEITINRSVSSVYELSRHVEVPFESKDGVTTIPVQYETNDGRLFLLLDEPIEAVSLEVPAEVSADIATAFSAEVLTEGGTPIEALIPVEVTLADANGKTLDGSGYGCAVDGRLEWSFTIPAETPVGSVYTATVTELASGKSVSKTISVK